MDNDEGDGLLSLDWRVLDVVGFKMTDEESIQSGEDLVVWGVSGVWEAIQEVGFRNFPLRLINQIFPKSVQALLGVVGMSDSVSV